MHLNHKKRIAVWSLFLGILVFLVLWLAPPPSNHFRLLDPTFKIVDVQFSRGRIHSVYCGGWQGRLRQKLHDYGIPVTRFGGLQEDSGGDTLALAVCYGGNLTAAEAQLLEAVLITAGGETTVLSAQSIYSNPTRKEHARVWTIAASPPEGSVLQLRTGTNRLLAELTVR